MSKADILSRIVETKKEEVVRAEKNIPEFRLRAEAENIKGKQRPFIDRLVRPGTNIIAEIKRASPSKGDICPDLDPAGYAAQYEAGGAAALSVLTDTQYFKGSFDDLKAARSAVSLPVLRKDFIISEYQIYQTAALGADAMLLIVRILSAEQLRDYMALAESVGLDVLVEVHTAEELVVATEANARLIGVNNRNLRSFDTDIGRAADMAGLFQPHQIPVSESGISSRADVERLSEAGIHNFLIGESIVRADDQTAFIRSLIGA